LSGVLKTNDPLKSSLLAKIFSLPEIVDPRLIAGAARLSEQLAAGSGQPPGGATAALVAAWAASLAAAAADRSRSEWEGAGGARAQARALRRRALTLAERGAQAYGKAVQELGSRGAAGSEGDVARDWRLGIAVKEAAEAPLELAICGLDIAQLAQLIATHAAGDVRADAVVAALLAASAARAGAHLVEINLVVGGEHGSAKQARALARAAAEAASLASELG
jgi:formiminotetrahydrofolate cyclodeaminase